jgi:hypothetical protein
VPLRPEKYPCPLHPTVDLTAQVQDQLDDRRPPVAYPGFRRKPKDPRFLFIVDCPGGKGDGSDAHEQAVSGESLP